MCVLAGGEDSRRCAETLRKRGVLDEVGCMSLRMFRALCGQSLAILAFLVLGLKP
jgi:hypothetical protein